MKLDLVPVRCNHCNRHVPVYVVYDDDDPDTAYDGHYCKPCAEKIPDVKP